RGGSLRLLFSSRLRGSFRLFGFGLDGSLVERVEPRLHLDGRLRLGAVAETLQYLLHVLGVGAEDRHHRRRHHEDLAVIGAVRTASEPRLPGERRADEIGQALQYVDAHGAAAERTEAGELVE